MAEDESFNFLVEWYDPQAALVRKYRLSFYPKDNTIEMYDLKNHRVFLRRSKTDSVKLEDLYIGGTVNILSRQLTFAEYFDEYTRKKLLKKNEKTLAVIKPDGMARLGEIINVICQHGFGITRMKMCRISRNEAMDFYKEHSSKEFYNRLTNYMSGGPIIAMELMGENAVNKWRELLGPTDSAEARSSAPLSIRAKFGTDTTNNACHGSDSPVSAARELEFYFPSTGPGCQNTATFSDCTCCVVKPHAVTSGLIGPIISQILEAGFQISAMQTFNLEKANAEEFLEVYKGVVHEFPVMVEELTSGPCLVLEIRAQDAPRTFREFCGPADPEIARHLRPRTLRALYGRDKIQNAVHCTDLPEDAILEVEYFFKILDR